MSPTAGMILVNTIMPLIAAAIARGAVRGAGCEDVEELTAEGRALAAKALDSAERRGKAVPPQSVAYYALEGLKRGRRSGYAGMADVLSAAATVCGRVSVRSMDESVAVDGDDPDTAMTLHDTLAEYGEDPDAAAGWNLDMAALAGSLDDRQRDVLLGTAQGNPLKEIAQRNGISPARGVQIKRQIAGQAVALFGDGVLADAGRESYWRQGLRAVAERRTARYERTQPQSRP
jgi:hypothetical protein